MEFPTIDEIAKEVTERALDKVTYEGKTLREWAEIIAKQQPSEDCISLNKLDDIITKAIDDSENQTECQTLRWVLDVMSELPPVTPKASRKKGKWLNNPDAFICSECGAELYDAWKYCPECGSYNGEEDDT